MQKNFLFPPSYLQCSKIMLNYFSTKSSFLLQCIMKTCQLLKLALHRLSKFKLILTLNFFLDLVTILFIVDSCHKHISCLKWLSCLKMTFFCIEKNEKDKYLKTVQYSFVLIPCGDSFLSFWIFLHACQEKSIKDLSKCYRYFQDFFNTEYREFWYQYNKCCSIVN